MRPQRTCANVFENISSSADSLFAKAFGMLLGLCTVQRDRGPWIAEWIAFHYLVGFRKFYFYAHCCTDDTKEVLTKLSQHFELYAFYLDGEMEKVQLACYQHAYHNYGHEVDWMAFLDGDEFLFPTVAEDMQTVLLDYQYRKISALAAYWVCFGSSGHIKEPTGLIIDNYKRRPTLDFIYNRHVKSIVRGHQTITADVNAHVFKTQFNTFDELLRPISHGVMKELSPSYEKLRINHYICQSYEYYHNHKKNQGFADAESWGRRSDDWWQERDINDYSDSAIDRFRDKVAKMVAEIS